MPITGSPVIQQLPMFAPSSDWTPPDINSLPSWADAGRVCIDLETKDPDLLDMGAGVRRDGSHIIGFGFAIEDGPAHYLPVAHAGGGNMDPHQVHRYLKEQVGCFKGTLVGANLQYDLDWLWEDDLFFNPKIHRDVQIADPLIYEHHRSYKLDAIAERWGLEGKDETLLRYAAEAYGIKPKRVKAEMWKLHSKFVGPYGEQDCRLPLALLRRQERVIDEQELWKVYDMESKLLPCLLRMKRRGVRIHEDRLEQVNHWATQQEQDQWDEIHRQTGVRVQFGDSMRVAALVPIFKELGIEVGTTEKTGKDSITTAFLKSVNHPVAGMIREARAASKIRTTYVESMRRFAVKGRIHATFNQLRKSSDEDGGDDGMEGARFGRLSSTKPNIQNQPARHPVIGQLWRSVFLPDEGKTWACHDFSQQEPRWLFHYAELAGCTNARAAAQAYRDDPATDTHQLMADMAGILRKPAKAILLGLCYGMGEGKLCNELGLPTEWIWSRRWEKMVQIALEEGKALLTKFNDKLPFIGELSDMCQEVAESRGYIWTAGRRRCRFEQDHRGEYLGGFRGISRLIQGSAGDQMKEAVILVDAAGFDPQIQVHDELDRSEGDPAEGKAIEEIMVSTMDCNVPHKVDSERGPDWGHITA